MAFTYEPIASQTLGSAASMVTFSSIPATYTDLVLVCVTGSSGATSSLNMQFNSISGSIYSRTMLSTLYGSLSSRVADDGGFRVGNRMVQTNPTTPGIAHIMSYANTNIFKTVLTETASASQEVYRSVQLWRSTDAVHTIYLTADYGAANLVAGSTFSLYGVGQT